MRRVYEENMLTEYEYLLGDMTTFDGTLSDFYDYIEDRCDNFCYDTEDQIIRSDTEFNNSCVRYFMPSSSKIERWYEEKTSLRV